MNILSDGKLVLQIDATIIAGLLILLALVFSPETESTLSSIWDESLPDFYKQRLFSPLAWVSYVGSLFAISALFASLGFVSKKHYDNIIGISMIFMLAGFIVLIIGFVSLGIIAVYG